MATLTTKTPEQATPDRKHNIETIRQAFPGSAGLSRES